MENMNSLLISEEVLNKIVGGFNFFSYEIKMRYVIEGAVLLAGLVGISLFAIEKVKSHKLNNKLLSLNFEVLEILKLFESKEILQDDLQENLEKLRALSVHVSDSPATLALTSTTAVQQVVPT